MFRLRGLSATIRELSSPVVTDAFAAITRLGDPPLLLVIVATYYWLATDRDASTRLVAFTLVAVAVTVSLKNGLALPRPPEAVQAVPAEQDSFGFPSGHAIGATVVYGGLVVVDDRLQRLGPATLVGLVVALIALSRVFIGVHYLGDVLVGIAVGGVILAALWQSETKHSRLVAVVAAGTSAAGLVITGGSADAALVFGGALGALVVFSIVDMTRLPAPETPVAAVILVATGVAVLGGTYALAMTLAHPLALVTGGFVMFSGSLVLPLTLDRSRVGRVVSK